MTAGCALSSAKTRSGPRCGALETSIAADAYSRDPQFYQFYQSMQAYKNSFKPGNRLAMSFLNATSPEQIKEAVY